MSKRGEGLTLRPAQLEERQFLENLQRRASLALPEYRQQLTEHPDAVQLPAAQIADGQVTVAEIGGAVVGFSALVGGELDGLFVDPEQWGQGVGQALVEAAAHDARRRGLTLTVVASPAARTFYEKCRFAVEGEAQTRFGPALRMSR